MTTIPMHDTASWWQFVPLAVMYLAFPAAAVNTYLAGSGFDKRQKELESWLNGHAGWTGGHKLRTQSDDETGQLQLTRRRHYNFDQLPGGWVVFAQGDYQPVPYRSAGETSGTRLPLEQYVDRIDKEVHTARVAAGRLAAALGTLFVAALQIYVRVTSS